MGVTSVWAGLRVGERPVNDRLTNSLHGWCRGRRDSVGSLKKVHQFLAVRCSSVIRVWMGRNHFGLPGSLEERCPERGISPHQ